MVRCVAINARKKDKLLKEFEKLMEKDVDNQNIRDRHILQRSYIPTNLFYRICQELVCVVCYYPHFW